MRNKALVVVLVIVSGLAIFGYYTLSQSIRYSLLQTYRAIRNHDATTLQKYADLNSIIDNAIDHLTDMDGELDPDLADIVDGFVSVVKPKLIPLVKQQIIDMVEQVDQDQDAEDDDIISDIAKRYIPSGKGKIYRGITHVKRFGKIALVGLQIYNPRYDTTLVLVVKMRDKGNYWQIADIPNIKDFVRQIDSLEQVRTDKINTKLTQQMNSMLSLRRFKKSSYRDEGWIFTTYKVLCRLTLQNTSGKTISTMQAQVYCLDDNNDTLTIFSLDNDKNIPPGDSITLTWDGSISRYNAKELKLYNTSSSHLHPLVNITSIEFEDGEELHLLDKWEDLDL